MGAGCSTTDEMNTEALDDEGRESAVEEGSGGKADDEAALDDEEEEEVSRTSELDDDEINDEEEDEEEEDVRDTAGVYTMTDGDSVSVTSSSLGMVPSSTAFISVASADTATGAPNTTVVSTAVSGRTQTAMSCSGMDSSLDAVVASRVVLTAPVKLDTWKLPTAVMDGGGAKEQLCSTSEDVIGVAVRRAAEETDNTALELLDGKDDDVDEEEEEDATVDIDEEGVEVREVDGTEVETSEAELLDAAAEPLLESEVGAEEGNE